VGVAVLVGYFAGVVGGIVLFALAAAAALLRVLATGPPDRRGPLTAAERDGPERDGAGRRRALVVANEAVGDPALWDQMQGEGDAPPAIEVLAPVLQSRTHFVTTDIDRETRDARRRLWETVTSARQHGVEASGEVGDPIDPLQGLADELRRYKVEEVIVATHSPNQENWVETEMLTHLHKELDIPVRHVVVDRPAMW
jgi:hypothetical protein